MEAQAAAVESAVDRALAEGLRTPDLGGDGDHRGGHPGRPQTPLRSSRGTSGPHLAQRRVRRLGGRQGPRTDARAALRHRRVRGDPRLRDRRTGTAIFRHHDHLERLFKSAELYYMPIPYTLEELRAATHELIAANELRECYIRPIAFRGYGQMGLYPLDAPVEVSIAVWPWGAYLGEEGKQQRHPRQGLELAADLARLADPARQGLRPVPQQRARQDRGARRPATRRRSCSTRTASSARARARTSTSSATASILTPPQTAGILDGINRRSVIQIARDLGYEVVERDLARAELYLADEVFLTGTAAELVPGARDRRPRDRRRRARARSRASSSACSTTRCTAATPRYVASWLDVVASVPASRDRRDAPSDCMTGSSSTTPPCATACRGRGCRCPPRRSCASPTASTSSGST